ncbi:hypothetical protein [Actinokineospora sp. UTMC 2448]|uniref:hypothetical protein n=1 Tax=Actinokineospora sp. UTMC 2448 TaxID=2268449 RepID=UPI002164A654|nr:hypothetical protein [Actinokineospora sp. UTMC 2448]UVS77681.1 hypothetical protein Actkin_01400 [Actinokineospora sp. UTMC 2448]
MGMLGGPAGRALAAAGVGGAVVLAWWAVLSAWPSAVFTLVGADDVSCPDAPGWGCAIGAAFVGFLLGVTIVLVSGIGLAAWGLRLVGVLPAAPVAALGPVFAFLLLWLGGEVLGDWGSLASAVVPVSLGYALAALITTPRARA